MSRLHDTLFLAVSNFKFKVQGVPVSVGFHIPVPSVRPISQAL